MYCKNRQKPARPWGGGIQHMVTTKLSERKILERTLILLAIITLLYILISIYFTKHFFFNTRINGVNVSLKAHDQVDDIIKSYSQNYRLQLIERNGAIEEIKGQDIGFQYNRNNSMYKIYESKKPLKWISSLFKKEDYYVEDLFIYNIDVLESQINRLDCLNKNIQEPQNVSFVYTNGSYEIVKEVYGNKLNKNKLREAIKYSLLHGEGKLDLEEKLCYENPKYISTSDKVTKTRALLNRYVSTKITYKFGDKKEVLDGNTINKWLIIDDNLQVTLNEIEVMKYVKALSEKYDTMGAKRSFKTTIGKVVEVDGGIYGWKINYGEETKAILRTIELGKVVEREPIYFQRAVSRGPNDIGDTYVEVNITRQRLWFYKNGKIIAQGPVVTGNPNRGNGTVVGTYMLNYKQKDTTLRGPNYEAKVTYWMPFYGNIGIHDASWRYSFGGNIYKTNGSHGCVNVPLYLAKVIFENIEEGTPIICYEE